MCDPNGLLRPTTTPPPPAHLNKSTHVIYITASAVIVILEPACVITGALPAAEFEGIAKAVQTFTQEGFFFSLLFRHVDGASSRSSGGFD